jgi:hypothetical protein
MTAPVMPELVEQLRAATAERACASGLVGIVAFGVGSEPPVMAFEQGRVVGPSALRPQATIKLTRKQFEAWSAGELSLSRAYMKGDLKPEGSTGALLAALEVLDDPQVIAGL